MLAAMIKLLLIIRIVTFEVVCMCDSSKGQLTSGQRKNTFASPKPKALDPDSRLACIHLYSQEGSGQKDSSGKTHAQCWENITKHTTQVLDQLTPSLWRDRE